MPSVQINSNIKLELKEILSGLSKSELPVLEQFLDQLSTVIAKKKAPNFSKKETELLLKINNGLPEKFLKRYSELLTKSAKKTLSPKEHEEVLEMVPLVEQQSVERLKHLIELAALWEMSVDDVMKKLQITPPEDIHG